MSGEDIAVRPRDDEHLYVYSEEDIQDILSDCFVDFREVVGDDEAAADCVQLAYQHLTDDFYSDE